MLLSPKVVAGERSLTPGHRSYALNSPHYEWGASRRVQLQARVTRVLAGPKGSRELAELVQRAQRDVTTALAPATSALAKQITVLASSLFQTISRLDIMLRKTISDYSGVPGVVRAVEAAEKALVGLSDVVEWTAAHASIIAGRVFRTVVADLRMMRAELSRIARHTTHTLHRQAAELQALLVGRIQGLWRHKPLVFYPDKSHGPEKQNQATKNQDEDSSLFEVHRTKGRRHISGLRSIEKPLPSKESISDRGSSHQGSLAQFSAGWEALNPKKLRFLSLSANGTHALQATGSSIQGVVSLWHAPQALNFQMPLFRVICLVAGANLLLLWCWFLLKRTLDGRTSAHQRSKRRTLSARDAEMLKHLGVSSIDASAYKAVGARSRRQAERVNNVERYLSSMPDSGPNPFEVGLKVAKMPQVRHNDSKTNAVEASATESLMTSGMGNATMPEEENPVEARHGRPLLDAHDNEAPSRPDNVRRHLGSLAHNPFEVTPSLLERHRVPHHHEMDRAAGVRHPGLQQEEANDGAPVPSNRAGQRSLISDNRLQEDTKGDHGLLTSLALEQLGRAREAARKAAAESAHNPFEVKRPDIREVEQERSTEENPFLRNVSSERMESFTEELHKGAQDVKVKSLSKNDAEALKQWSRFRHNLEKAKKQSYWKSTSDDRSRRIF